ncbi:tensin-3 isoform X1 [Esox lucius]|uniref:tensin-3 isoform X1 n=2 Tax=Esox lucius TaxID=8010 RepID=UPI001476B5A9|nr:tensin-3 isoform X1 [Esox lucius]XP_010870748.2 tensin-3 isoform X1 [Esox lucius]
MEAEYRIDLDYITERIITVSFSKAVPDQIYIKNLQDITQMIKSKHGHNYMVINLSEKNASLTQMNPEVLDTGWLDGLAPSLEQMCDVCKTMENWLQSHTKHVLVIHCQGGQGRVGVLVATYIHFSCLSDSADLALDHFAMRKFYNDKVSSLMSPSQKRYVWMFSSLLKGVMKMNPSPLFLPCVLLHGVPVLTPEGGRISRRLFLRVYQNLQAVCTSAVHQVGPGRTDSVYFVLQPAQLLKGDIMVVCYNKNPEAASREVIFRLQFHTGVIHGHPMLFPKQELDIANKDPRFPVDGKVELMFYDSPEKMPGIGCWKNGPSVMIDYDTLDPLIRRDSYENISPDGKDLPLSPVDARLYVRKRSTDEGGALFPPASSGPNPVDLNMSTSSDSGLSIASQWNGANPRRGPSQDKCTQPRRVLSEVNPEPAQCLPKDMAELPGSSNGGEGLVGEGQRIKGEPLPSERETDILDDYEASHKATLALGRPSEASIGLLSSGTQRLVQSGRTYSTKTTHTTQSWIQQQQMVDAHPQTYPHTDEEELTDRRRLISPPISQEAMSFPATPSRGSSSREAVLRVVVGGVGGGELLVPNDTDTKAEHTKHTLHTTRPTHTPHDTHAKETLPVSGEPCGQEELALLATDMDESIEQLNQLILDLDPTFIPVPTRHHPLHLSCSASLYANGTSQMTTHPNGSQSGINHIQASDVTDYPGFHSPGWAGTQTFQNFPPCYKPNLSPSQHGRIYGMDSVDYQGQTTVMDGYGVVPPTPAFPVTPPTPYVKHFPVTAFPYLKSGEGQGEMSRTSRDSRSFLGSSMTHTPASSDGELFHPDVSGTSASCQIIFGSMPSVSSGSPFPPTDCQTPPPVWSDRTPTSVSSPFHLRSFPSQSPLSLPNAHSSPQWPSRSPEVPGGQSQGERSEGDQRQENSLLLGNWGLERSLLEAMEGLDLGLDLGLAEDRLGGLPPLLPEKRVLGLGQAGSRSPSLSGFSSPLSGSCLSIPFPSASTPDPLRGPSTAGGGAPLLGSDTFASKQDTVKFVQDTSKFWYKPDISRDQAIVVLKDREPGSFIVRDSHSFRGAYGLAMKVSSPPPSVLTQSKKVSGDLSNELVRHFLIECTQKGVRLKGCPNEPYFGSLTALVCQHAITPLALPCKLIIPGRDPLEETSESSTQTATNSAADLLKQGAACNVWFLGSVELESLTGYQAVQKAASQMLAMDPPPTSTVVHFKVSTQGITLTDNQRKLFFRRHYNVNTVIFCALDPQDRKWTKDGCTSAKIFGFVARKSMSGAENVCHVFAEHDPEQPASAIVNFVSKVMIGSTKK